MDNGKGIWIFMLVVVSLVVGIWLYQTLAEGYTSDFPYAQLGKSYNPQLFSPCVSKRCAGGPYMYTSNPYLQALCEGASNEELAQANCSTGLQGKPAQKFDYSAIGACGATTTSTDDNQYGAWSNALCDTPSTTSLCVL